MEDILITGINGYIGSNLARTLLFGGNRVIGLDLAFNNLGDLKDDPNLSYFAADISDAAAIPADAGDAGTLVHCAALVHKRSTDLSRENYFRINHLGTRNVLRHIGPARLKKIIFLSTVSVYGNIPPGIEPDENMKPGPDDFYGESKLAAEEEIRSFAARHNIPYIILRLSPVYGRSFLLNLHKRIYLPGHHCFYRVGGGNQKLSLCSVNNVVDVISAGLHTETLSGQNFNIRDFRNYSINDIISFFNRVSGKNKPVITIPAAIPHMAFSCLSLVVPKKAEYYKYQFRKISMDATYSIERLRGTGTNLRWDLESTFAQGPGGLS
jgi:nucleoside-diphosphate-sugar epimerase